MGSPISDAIDKLTQSVDALSTVEQGATQTIATLVEQLRANKDSPTAIAALADKLDAVKNDLAAAIANVPA